MKILKKKKIKFKTASAMMIIMLIFFTIFIMAFGSGYLVFLNIFKTSDISDSLKARYASLTGVDRAQYEAIKNNYNFAGNCLADIFSDDLEDGSSFTITCEEEASGKKKFYSVGRYKKSEVITEITCVNIEEECSASCLNGAICGGGKLFLSGGRALVVSPPACNAGGTACDNNFSVNDSLSLEWDSGGGSSEIELFCGDDFVDPRDNQSYPTVKIGDQCWMAENLNIGTKISGSASQADNSQIEKYCYNNDDSNCNIYGGLYQWNEAMKYEDGEDGSKKYQGICPDGWHLPDNDDWEGLKSFLSASSTYYCGSNSNYIAKSLAATTLWTTNTNNCAIGNNLSANNSSGFTALPVGIRNTNGDFSNLSKYALFWSASPEDGSTAWVRALTYGNPELDANNFSRRNGLSVRCLKDDDNPWSGGGSEYMGADDLDDGEANIANLDLENNDNFVAAKYCDDLNINGFSDWYLPAVNELDAVRTSPSFPYYNFRNSGGDDYWTSNEEGENSPERATYLKMSTGNISNIDKDSTLRTRCVRPVYFSFSSGGDNSGSGYFTCGDTFTDSRDGNIYPTVKIGNQCWMAKNLAYLPEVHNNRNGTEPRYYVYGYNGIDVAAAKSQSNYSTYGVLYNWPAAQTACPNGWRPPLNNELLSLNNYLSNNSEHYCDNNSLWVAKSLAATSTWNPSSNTCAIGNNISSNNISGFNALGAGRFEISPEGFNYLLTHTYFWSSDLDAYLFVISYNSNIITNRTLDKGNGLSVRCIKDD